MSRLSLKHIYEDLETLRDERQVHETLPLKDEADIIETNGKKIRSVEKGECLHKLLKMVRMHYILMSL